MEKILKKLKMAKQLGGIGGILLIAAAIPQLGALFGVAGLVLLILGVKKISEAIGKKEVFWDYIKAIIFTVIGIFLATVAFLLLVISLFGILAQKLKIPNQVNLPFPEFPESNLILTPLFIGTLLSSWLLLILGSYFLKKSFLKIGKETKVSHFALAGKLYFIGAWLSIILVGWIINFVAHILTILAFFSLPKELPKVVTPQIS